MQKNNILGLSVGTQLMGLARINKRSLEDWQVKNFEGNWSKMKLKIILLFVERYIQEHGVTSVVLKIPEPCNSSSAIEMLTNSLIWLCESKNIRVHTCTIVDLKQLCGATNKSELIQYVIALYPELSHVFAKSQKVKKVYYARIFEAVLATLL